MTTIQGLTKKLADFFCGEDFYENEQTARLSLTTDDARLIVNLIKENSKLRRDNRDETAKDLP